jgi:hypothetical protein
VKFATIKTTDEASPDLVWHGAPAQAILEMAEGSGVLRCLGRRAVAVGNLVHGAVTHKAVALPLVNPYYRLQTWQEHLLRFSIALAEKRDYERLNDAAMSASNNDVGAIGRSLSFSMR